MAIMKFSDSEKRIIHAGFNLYKPCFNKYGMESAEDLFNDTCFLYLIRE